MPSTASLARIFREAGVARLEPKKKPRSAWRRFVYPAPNACWQLDATEYVLTGGRKCVIFQLIDDHSRYAVGSHVAWGETAKAAITVFDKAVAAHGVPNDCCPTTALALNPSRRGFLGQLVDHVWRWAWSRSPASRTSRPPRARTNASTRPCSATSTNSHWPTPWPNCRPRSTRSTTSTTPSVPTRDCRAASRPRLHGRPPPRPKRLAEPEQPLVPTSPTPPARAGADRSPDDTRVKKLTSAGTFLLDKVHYKVDVQRAFQQVLVITDGDKITVTDLEGEILIEHTRPAPGVIYVGNRRPRGPRPKTLKRHRCPETPSVTDVLMQNCHRCPETDGVAVEVHGAQVWNSQLVPGQQVRRTAGDLGDQQRPSCAVSDKDEFVDLLVDELGDRRADPLTGLVSGSQPGRADRAGSLKASRTAA